MSDPDRFISLLRRQQTKVAHAQSLMPVFRECGHELGRWASLRDIAAWLEARGVKPSPRGAGKWTAQTVKEFVANMDGDEPTSSAVCGDRRRGEGMRIAISRELWKARSALDVKFGMGTGDEMATQVEQHCTTLLLTAQKVRSALHR